MNHALLLCAILLFALPAQAGNLKTITLNDGTRIHGRVVSLENGRYTVESSALGQITINEDKIQSIAGLDDLPAATPASAAQPAAATPDINAVQAQIMSDPALLQDITALASDPEVLALISDPAFMQAVQARNTAALENDPKMKALMNNPKIRALVNKLNAPGN